MALGAQFGVDAWRSVSFPVLRMNPLDFDQQLAVGDPARALRPRSPRVEARWRHAQRITHNPHRPDTPVILDQAEPHLGSSEKMATAFFKMSRSIRRRSFSRRKREISDPKSGAECGAGAGIGRSADPAFRPSLRLRQLRSIAGEMPSSLAICSNGRPLL